jgi:hypothetical protein
MVNYAQNAIKHEFYWMLIPTIFRYITIYDGLPSRFHKTLMPVIMTARTNQSTNRAVLLAEACGTKFRSRNMLRDLSAKPGEQPC